MSITSNTFNMRTLPTAGRDFHVSLQSEDLSGCEAILAAASGYSHYITKLKIRTDAAMDISIGSGGDGGTSVTTVHFGPIPFAETLGAELVVNGGFDTGEDWVLGDDWVIEGGNAEYGGDIGADDPSLSQEIDDIVSGNIYRVQFEAYGSLITDDDIIISLGGGTGLAITSFAEDGGTYTAELTAGGNGLFKINDDSPADYTSLFIDNVSVKEIAGSGVFKWKAPPGMGLKFTSGLSAAIDSTAAGTMWIEAHGKTCKD